MYFTLIIILFVIVVCVPLLYILWFKLKHPFWAKQPVFNYYNLYYWIMPADVIDSDLPEITKFYNIRNIVFKNVTTLTEKESLDVVELLQNHYYKNETIHYYPKARNIFPYLSNNNNNSYISLYYKDKKVVGMLAGRPLHVTIQNTNFLTYYADYLCVDKNHRNNNISPNLIYTHYYNQRHRESHIVTSLFKREHLLNDYVPLVKYETYTFDISNWITYSLHRSVKIVKITEKNITYLHEFLKKQKHKFKCFITSHISNILHLITTNNIIIYCGMINDIVYSAYFLRDLSTKYLKKKSFECFASIKDCSMELFLFCFSNIMYYFKNNFSILIIENVSDNDVIINNVLLKYKYMSKVNSAFYFYNYAIRSIKNNDFCCIY